MIANGYSVKICCVCLDFNIHHLSAVLLKQFIKQHWQEGEENFIHPAVSAEEKVCFLFLGMKFYGMIF